MSPSAARRGDRIAGRFIALLGGSLIWFAGLNVQQSAIQASAQTSCEMVPAGPARTDCYAGLSRINGERSRATASAARRQRSEARYQKITGTHRSKERPDAVSIH